MVLHAKSKRSELNLSASLKTPPLPSLVVKELTLQEKLTLEHCEDVLKQHLSAFFEVGRALLEIRNKKLYRADFGTFEEYCETKWDMTKGHAYRLLHGAEVLTNLSPMGDFLPQNERQVRPLTNLEPKVAAKAWKLAIEKASNGKLTSSIVKEAVAEVTKCRVSIVRNAERESWQLNVKPLLARAIQALENRDKTTLRALLEKMILLVDIGDHNRQQNAD
jgi:hypothetical protein